jgi:hypothetical protein
MKKTNSAIRDKVARSVTCNCGYCQGTEEPVHLVDEGSYYSTGALFTLVCRNHGGDCGKYGTYKHTIKTPYTWNFEMFCQDTDVLGMIYHGSWGADKSAFDKIASTYKMDWVDLPTGFVKLSQITIDRS